MAVGALLLLAAPAAFAQWRVVSPPAAAGWFATLDTLRLAGNGALPLTRTAGAPVSALGRALAAERFAILHFVPLYYPSASLAELAQAVEDAAGAGAPQAARAQFVVGALRRAIPEASDRRLLAELAAMTRRASPQTVSPAHLAAWQAAWNSRFAPALAPFFASERLNAGLILVVPALGPEGRVFAGVPADRTDNIVAVGTPLGSTDADGPLYAAVRELCFPLVSRTADATPAFRRDARSPRDAARRASLAAVRFGADLLDRVLPAEAAGYRAHWRAVAGAAAASFDALFPPDPLLTPPLTAALPKPARSP